MFRMGHCNGFSVGLYSAFALILILQFTSPETFVYGFMFQIEFVTVEDQDGIFTTRYEENAV